MATNSPHTVSSPCMQYPPASQSGVTRRTHEWRACPSECKHSQKELGSSLYDIDIDASGSAMPVIGLPMHVDFAAMPPAAAEEDAAPPSRRRSAATAAAFAKSLASTPDIGGSDGAAVDAGSSMEAGGRSSTTLPMPPCVTHGAALTST